MRRRRFMKYGAGALGLTLIADRAGGQQEDETRRTTMKMKLMSVLVDDQDEALTFYTDILGFVKKADFPVGQFKWLTVVSPDEPDGPELLLEPSDNPAVQTFKRALVEQGIAAKAFAVEDIQYEYDRLRALGVVFRTEPINVGTATIAVFDDTCGNLIQIYQV